MVQSSQKKGKNKKEFLLVIIGIFFIIIGSSVLIYDYNEKENIQKIEEKSIDEFFEDDTSDVKEIITEEPKSEVHEEIKINYVAILEIPKINLKKGLVDKNSYLNNVNRNIYTLKETIYPNDDISHIVLAGHSGNSSVSFFKNLYRLRNNDQIYFYYNNIKYIYQINNYYEIEKTGKMNLNLSEKSDITIITCKSGTNKQYVYKAILVNQENY